MRLSSGVAVNGHVKEWSIGVTSLTMFALGPIWKDPGLVVSVVAFLSSFGPTCSAYRTDLRFCIRCEIQPHRHLGSIAPTWDSG